MKKLHYGPARFLLTGLLLAGCADMSGDGQTGEVIETGDSGPCYARDIAPAVIETVTEQIEDTPAVYDDQDELIQPATYRTETRQEIIREREELWFETPCERDLTPDFIASLQRALESRGFYSGQISGRMDRRTRQAVRAFQAPQGLDSAIVSVAAAQQLGLVAYGRAAAAGNSAAPVSEID